MASKLEVADGVAVVTLDNPKMNQLTPDRELGCLHGPLLPPPPPPLPAAC